MKAAASPIGHVLRLTSETGSCFVMLGGFFGAGKTTLAMSLAKWLSFREKTVAYLANDQGSEAIDAGIVGASGLATGSVTTGSFSQCFEALVSAAETLRGQHQPDVIIAEPVGSCADLIATVGHRLIRVRQNDFQLAPYTVVVDPSRAAKVFSAGASEKVSQLFRRQLGEADYIVINKIDVTAQAELEKIRGRLAREFARATVFPLSARTGAGLEEWANAVMTGQKGKASAVELEPESYLEGEALFASVNCRVQLSALKGFECNPILRELARSVQRRMQSGHIELAHLKMTLAPEVDVTGIATLSLSDSDWEAQLGAELDEPVERGNLHMSLRAEGKPDALHAIVTDALTHVCAVFPEVFARVGHMEHFRPGAVSLSGSRT